MKIELLSTLIEKIKVNQVEVMKPKNVKDDKLLKNIEFKEND